MSWQARQLRFTESIQDSCCSALFSFSFKKNGDHSYWGKQTNILIMDQRLDKGAMLQSATLRKNRLKMRVG